jgi:myo-inositol 2-dehydrogenase / D-chiro-inositol 1-dehydrogenase
MRHARHFAFFTPKAEIIAVCSPVQKELDAAAAEFGPLRTYLDYDDMIAKETELQAVIVSSATTVHADHAIKAINKGLHVLCEKPLSTSVEIVRLILSNIILLQESLHRSRPCHHTP